MQQAMRHTFLKRERVTLSCKQAAGQAPTALAASVFSETALRLLLHAPAAGHLAIQHTRTECKRVVQETTCIISNTQTCDSTFADKYKSYTCSAPAAPGLAPPDTSSRSSSCAMQLCVRLAGAAPRVASLCQRRSPSDSKYTLRHCCCCCWGGTLVFAAWLQEKTASREPW
jgi:hypothetical protein